jgi:hypothetical protein
MDQLGVTNAFTSASSPNLTAPSFDRAWLLGSTLPTWGTVYNGAGTQIYYSGTFQNCSSRTWDGNYCVVGGEDKYFGGSSSQCLTYYVPPGGTWAPAGYFPTTSGNQNVIVRFTVGTYPFIATLAQATSHIRVAFNWTQADYTNLPNWINLGSTGFRAEASADSGATWYPLPWNGSSWSEANGYIAPVPGAGAVALNPTAGNHRYGVSLLAPFTGCYKINYANIADMQHRTWTEQNPDDGVYAEIDDAYWGVADTVRNRTWFFVDPSGWYDPANGTGGCFRVNAVGGMAARIFIHNRADNGADLTHVDFGIRAMQDE